MTGRALFPLSREKQIVVLSSLTSKGLIEWRDASLCKQAEEVESLGWSHLETDNSKLERSIAFASRSYTLTPRTDRIHAHTHTSFISPETIKTI